MIRAIRSIYTSPAQFHEFCANIRLPCILTDTNCFEYIRDSSLATIGGISGEGRSRKEFKSRNLIIIHTDIRASSFWP